MLTPIGDTLWQWIKETFYGKAKTPLMIALVGLVYTQLATFLMILSINPADPRAQYARFSALSLVCGTVLTLIAVIAMSRSDSKRDLRTEQRLKALETNADKPLISGATVLISAYKMPGKPVLRFLRKVSEPMELEQSRRSTRV
ncbi:hypothetical protein [Ensifer sp. OTU672]|uniref:hypothetical protein n=1 Tax=Ensifer sp. OTU672 TaxID=3043861 RepID=UPI00313B77B2